jgi:hypothetical protein
LTRRADLTVAGQPAIVNHRPAGSDFGPQSLGELLNGARSLGV